MTIARVYILRCAGGGCDETLVDTRRRGDPRDPDKFRRWARTLGWRRLNRTDLCPTCTTNERTRARIAALPKGLF